MAGHRPTGLLFVEDMVRALQRIKWNSENFESIHNHSAYAMIERDKGLAH